MKNQQIVLGICIILLIPSSLASALVAKGVSSSDLYCHGTLTIAYEDADGNLDSLTLEGNRLGYPDLKRGHPVMRKHTISYVEVSGDCCWGLYPQILFRGEDEIAFPGEGILYTNFQPLSIKKMECPF